MDNNWLTAGTDPDQPGAEHLHTAEEWTEVFARTIAHLAAQLTMTQLRLRALATEIGIRGGVDPDAVQLRLNALAEAETGAYLRENLGEALAAVVDIDALKTEISTFLQS